MFGSCKIQFIDEVAGFFLSSRCNSGILENNIIRAALPRPFYTTDSWKKTLCILHSCCGYSQNSVRPEADILGHEETLDCCVYNLNMQQNNSPAPSLN